MQTKSNNHTYTNVIFDLDSTLVTIEGIDELALLKNAVDQVAPMTKRAMNGEITFEEVFFKRLDIIRPTYEDILTLGQRYRQHVTPGARELIHELLQRGTRVFVISGGYNPAVSIVTRDLNVSDAHVFANELVFDHTHQYKDVRRTFPLWKNNGKYLIVQMLREAYPGTFAFVGDSMSDCEAAKLTERFICFAGVEARLPVINRSETYVIEPSIYSVLRYL